MCFPSQQHEVDIEESDVGWFLSVIITAAVLQKLGDILSQPSWGLHSWAHISWVTVSWYIKWQWGHPLYSVTLKIKWQAGCLSQGITGVAHHVLVHVAFHKYYHVGFWRQYYEVARTGIFCLPLSVSSVNWSSTLLRASLRVTCELLVFTELRNFNHTLAPLSWIIVE